MILITGGLGSITTDETAALDAGRELMAGAAAGAGRADAGRSPPPSRLPRPRIIGLAREVLLYGTYDEAPQLCRALLQHADALAGVAPFSVPAEQIAETIEAISCS